LHPYKRFGDVVSEDALMAMSEADFDALVAAKKELYDQWQAEEVAKIEEAAAERERARIKVEQEWFEAKKRQEEAKRQEELAKAKDIEKWADVVTYLQNTPVHEMRSSQYRTKMKIVKDFLSDILKPV
jgi:hypothetical protein